MSKTQTLMNAIVKNQSGSNSHAKSMNLEKNHGSINIDVEDVPSKMSVTSSWLEMNPNVTGSWLLMNPNPSISVISNSSSELTPTPNFQSAELSDEVIDFTAYCIAKVVQSVEMKTENTDIGINEGIKSGLVYLLKKMRKHMALRITELLQALCLIDKVKCKPWKHGLFTINLNNVYMVLLVSVLLAHKNSSDRPYSNGFFSRSFGAELLSLNESEVVVLGLLEWNVTMSNAEYDKYYMALVERSG